MSKAKKSQVTHDETEHETTAADLIVMLENGETAEALARIQTLSQRNFIEVLRTIQQLDTALANYALSWQNAEYWGRGTPYPDELKAKVEAAGKIAHEVASADYGERYRTALDGALRNPAD